MRYGITIDGRWLSEVCGYGGATYGTLADRGLDAASFTLDPGPDGDPSIVRPDALVRIYADTEQVWMGRVESVDPSSLGVQCTSIWEDGYTIPALTSGGAMTRDVAVACLTARAAPWLWQVAIGGVTGTASGSTDQPAMVAHLLEDLAADLGVRVGVVASGAIYLRADPTTPKWIITAPINLGAAPAAPNVLIARYDNVTTGSYATAFTSIPASGRAVCSPIIDLTKRGPMHALEALVLLDGMRAQIRRGRTWLTGMTVDRAQITTLGDTPAALDEVRGGDMVRIMSLTASQQSEIGAPYLDVVLGRVVNSEDTPDSIYLEPIGVMPQSMEDLLELVG